MSEQNIFWLAAFIVATIAGIYGLWAQRQFEEEADEDATATPSGN
jgi:hypothetical protein